jgi:hypothetical protein
MTSTRSRPWIEAGDGAPRSRPVARGRVDGGVIRRASTMPRSCPSGLELQARRADRFIGWRKAHLVSCASRSAARDCRFAEIVRERRDEAEPPAGFAHAHIARRTAGAVVDLVQGPALRQLRPPSASGRYWSSRASPPISPIGMTSMKVRSNPSASDQPALASPGRYPKHQSVRLGKIDYGWILIGRDAGDMAVEGHRAAHIRRLVPRTQ